MMEGWRHGGYKNFSRRSRSIAKKVFRLRSVEADQPASVFSRQSFFFCTCSVPESVSSRTADQQCHLVVGGEYCTGAGPFTQGRRRKNEMIGSAHSNFSKGGKGETERKRGGSEKWHVRH